ncbi:MAG: hypothetical protein D8M58_18920 [Calditrichaeota bacterium]|nr:MAG: hypothetical protein DWQ03_21600 [Calditrichota bacterium]MBL1207483.1 hypothetical protein [Calditrichota bacterium]NOG47315.1 PorV/PorQ family protein [Calditrichota bacterium]
MKKVILFLFLSISFTFAGENAGLAGSFTRLGLGARAIAMGNTGVAAPARGYSFYYNPALSGMQEQKVFTNSYNFLSQDRHIYFLGFSMKVPPGAGLSVGWLKSGTSDIPSHNSIGNNTGEVNHHAHGVYASFSRQFSERFSVGLTIKALFEFINDGTKDFDYESKGVGGDIGVFYKASEDISVGLVYKDIGSKLKANTEKLFELGGTTIDDFPKLIRAGVFYKTPFEGINFAYDFEISSTEEYSNHIGFETIHGRNLALRLGLIEFLGEDTKRDIQFVAGAGFDFKLYTFHSNLDYAFIGPKFDEGSSHLFSWEIYF